MKNQENLPVGTIARNHQFAYGFDGKKYYVVEGAFEYYLTRVHLCFDEAKQLFEAFTFNNPKMGEFHEKTVGNIVKEGRKQKLTGNDLFWFYQEKLK